MKYRALLPVFLLLCGCAGKTMPVSEPVESAQTVLSAVPADADTEAALNRILRQAETLETETAGSGLRWCALAAELLELSPPPGCAVPKIAPEALHRLHSAALLLAGCYGAGLLEDCGHEPLSRAWSEEEIQALFAELESAGNYAEIRAKTA